MSIAITRAAIVSLGLFWKPSLLGLVGALGLLSFYLGVISLAQDPAHALAQLSEDRWFVGAIVIGFGTQIGLFTHLRGLRLRDGRSTAVAATGTGTGTVSMLACCAHHLTDVLPVLGLSGAAVFLNEYKTPLMALGIVMNLVGIVYMLCQIRRQQRSHCTVKVASTVLAE